MDSKLKARKRPLRRVIQLVALMCGSAAILGVFVGWALVGQFNWLGVTGLAFTNLLVDTLAASRLLDLWEKRA